MVEIEGIERSALVFDYSVRGMSAGLIALVSLGIIGGISAIVLTGWSRLLGLALVALVLAGLAAVVAGLRSESYYALVRDGIYGKSQLVRTFVPWDSIESVSAFDLYGQQMLGLKTRYAPRSNRGWLVSLARFDRNILGWDLAFPLSLIKSADRFRSLVEQCAHDVDARRQL